MVKSGLPDLGYPHQSPEQRLAGESSGYNIDILPEDLLTHEVVMSTGKDVQRMARWYWSRGKKPTEIAVREKILNKHGNPDRDLVRRRLEWVQDMVAEKVLM